MIVRSAGFVSADLISSQNVLNFGYILYLALRAEGMHASQIESAVRRWMVMALLTGRYSGSAESAFDSDIRQIRSKGFDGFGNSVIEAELSDPFWKELLPQHLDTSSTNSPYFRLFLAAQVKMNDHGFLSRDITVQDLILNHFDVHHVYPRNYLKSLGLPRSRYNQIANYVAAQSEIKAA